MYLKERGWTSENYKLQLKNISLRDKVVTLFSLYTYSSNIYFYIWFNDYPVLGSQYEDAF